jgi:hypothetical protein|tara:strand:+ start:667 stop:1098 length:432 start_codon:yes stop_codon:yes gene_type:complete
MAHSRLVVGSYTVEFHGDKKYQAKWDLALYDEGIIADEANTRELISDVGYNFLELTIQGQIVTEELGGKSADKYIFDTVIPALNLLGDTTTGTLTLELNTGQLVATGWVTNAVIDRFVESGMEVIDISFTFICESPPTHSGLT